MEQQERHAEIVRRLGEAGAAHATYEKQELNGVYDEQWADWYADYLIKQGWNDLFLQEWTRLTLAGELSAANTVQRANAPDANWQEFYADRFVTVE